MTFNEAPIKILPSRLFPCRVDPYLVIVASEASDLYFKTIIFHVVPSGPQLYTQGFLDGGGGGGGAWDDDM